MEVKTLFLILCISIYSFPCFSKARLLIRKFCYTFKHNFKLIKINNNKALINLNKCMKKLLKYRNNLIKIDLNNKVK